VRHDILGVLSDIFCGRYTGNRFCVLARPSSKMMRKLKVAIVNNYFTSATRNFFYDCLGSKGLKSVLTMTAGSSLHVMCGAAKIGQE